MGSVASSRTDQEARIRSIICALRGRGQRLTPQRLAILRTFLDRTDHPSAETILEVVRRDFPAVAPSTVYHMLHALVEMGEAVEVSPATHRARFDPNTHDHCHLVCLACRAIIDVPLEQCHRPIDDSTLLTQHGFQPALRVHQITGLCRACRTAAQPTG